MEKLIYYETIEPEFDIVINGDVIGVYVVPLNE